MQHSAAGTGHNALTRRLRASRLRILQFNWNKDEFLRIRPLLLFLDFWDITDAKNYDVYCECFDAVM